MIGKAAFFPGLAATLLLVATHRLIALATLRWGWLGWLVESRPIRVIVDGKSDPRAMKHGNRSEKDMKEAIWIEGVAEPSQVHLATLAGSGRLSVIPKERK